MTQEPNSPHRGLAIAAATAGLTLAVGVTIGAFLGFVRAPSDATSSEPEVTVSESSSLVTTAEHDDDDDDDHHRRREREDDHDDH